MVRPILAGSLLNEIAGDLRRHPAFQVVVWNPNLVTINDVAAGTVSQAPFDMTPFVDSIDYNENIGFENGNDPTTPQAAFTFRRNPATGQDIRRGMIEDGVIVQIRQGDIRVIREEWIPIFTGTFRGRPGDNPGSPAEGNENLTAVAFGREERHLNQVVTTEPFDSGTDLGDIAVAIAQRHMGLGQDEILFGNQGFTTPHLTNQIVEENALSALWQLLFPVGRKPRFDSLGRLIAVDVNLDKPAARIFSAGDFLIRSLEASPNDIEVNNSVVVKGLSATLTKAIQDSQLLTEFELTTGFFESSLDHRTYYSQDRTQRAEETFLVERKPIRWSDADWAPIDEFSGVIDVDTRHLRNVRSIIFAAWLVTQLAVATLDFLFQEGGDLTSVLDFTGTIASIRLGLQLASLATMAALLWSMNFIGRGEFEIHGKPFEFVYQELVARHQMTGLALSEVREVEFRNDFIATIETLDAIAEERLRREMLKNQINTMTMMDDPVLEVDDIIETANGDRYYITSIRKRIQRGAENTMTITGWKVHDGAVAAILALLLEEKVQAA